MTPRATVARAARRWALAGIAVAAALLAAAAAAASASAPARVIVVAGRPLGEPIAQYGPFVMNTTDELQRAVHDFQRGALAT